MGKSKQKSLRSLFLKELKIIEKIKVASKKDLFILGSFAIITVMLTRSVALNIKQTSSVDSEKNIHSSSIKDKFVEGELLVIFKDNHSKDDEDLILKEHGAKVKDEIKKIKVKRISVSEEKREKLLERLSKNPNVEFVENNYIAGIVATPNDPQYSSQWHLAKISAPQAWDIGQGSIDVPITICDTGIDPYHPDLSGKLLSGWNVYDNSSDTTDGHGHGTSVAGSVMAITNNGIGIAGLAANNPIIPVRISNINGSSSHYAMAECLIYGADRGSRVINISFGSSSSSTTLQKAANYAKRKGAIIFAAAGNSNNSNPLYPAACNNVVAVSATAPNDSRASFSSYGNFVDISAPGESIYSTIRGGGYQYVGGTSFASPIAAGLAALIISVNPSLSASNVEQIIQENADDLGDIGYDIYFGHGRINALKSLQAAIGSSSTPDPVIDDTTPPTVNMTSPLNNTIIGAKASVNISADASDENGIDSITILLDGKIIKTCVSSTSCLYKANSKLSKGTHTTSAIAKDNSGNTTNSQEISFIKE